MVLNRAKPVPILTPGKTKDKNLYQIIDEFETTQKDDKSKISTKWRLEAHNIAVNQIKAQKTVSKQLIEKSAVFKGMRIFQEYPKAKYILDVLEKKAAGDYSSKEEYRLYYNPDVAECTLKNVTEKTGSYDIYVTEDIKKYIGHICHYLDLSQGDLALYFFCLGIADMDFVVSKLAMHDIKKVIQLINAHIIEREYIIEKYYRYYKDPEYLEKCLETCNEMSE